MEAWKVCEQGWELTKENGAVIELSWEQARELQLALRRYDAWDEVDCRMESGQYDSYKDAISEAREDIIDAILEETEIEIDGDIVYDAISCFVDFPEDEEHEECDDD